MPRYSAAEIKSAKQAYQFLINAGFPSKGQAIELLTGGDLSKCPITKKDVLRAFELFGEHPARIKGTLENRKVGLAPDDFDKPLVREKLTFYSDIVTIESQEFLITIAQPVHLIQCTPLARCDGPTCFIELGNHIAKLRAERYDVAEVIVDREPAFSMLQGKYPGIAIRLGGAGDHNPHVDQACRSLKDMYRCVRLSLQWEAFPKDWAPALVSFCVCRLNMHKGRALEAAPRVSVLGFKPRFDYEYDLGFGQYCEVKDPSSISNDVTSSRTHSCISFYPMNNRQHSWRFLNLETGKTVVSTVWRAVPINKFALEKISAIARSQASSHAKIVEEKGVSRRKKEVHAQSVTEKEPSFQVSVPSGNDVSSALFTSVATSAVDPFIKSKVNEVVFAPHAVAIDVGSSPPVSDSVPVFPPSVSVVNPSINDSKSLVDPSSAPKLEVTPPSVLLVPASVAPRREGLRSKIPLSAAARRFQKLTTGASSAFVDRSAASKVFNPVVKLSLGQGLKRYTEKAEEAAMKELSQLLKQEVFPYVHHSESLPVVYSQMIISEKVDPSGKLIKIKGRFVANGKTQKLLPWQESYSPTFEPYEFLAMCKDAAVKKKIMWVADVGSAYTKANIDTPTFMMISKSVVELLRQLDPKCIPFIRDDGCLLVRVTKALYGLQQAGALWRERLIKFLLSLGFKQNKASECSFHKHHGNDFVSILVWVDDLCMTAAVADNLKWLTDRLRSEFVDLSLNCGPQLDFLGMKVDHITDGSFSLSMPKLIAEIVGESFEKTSSPANENLFLNDGDQSPIPSDARKLYARIVAQLLYLGRWVRPDLLLTASVLARKAAAPTVSDLFKLKHARSFLFKTVDGVFFVSTSSFSHVRAYFDASFAQHADLKSHSGGVIEVGGTPIWVKSKKQHLNTVNSTESEIVAMSDYVHTAIRVCDYLCGYGYDLPAPVILQDNTSAIQITSLSSKPYRSKYIGVRQIGIQELHETAYISVQFVRSENMWADGLTKPLQGKLLAVSRNRLLGLSTSSEAEEVRGEVRFVTDTCLLSSIQGT